MQLNVQPKGEFNGRAGKSKIQVHLKAELNQKFPKYLSLRSLLSKTENDSYLWDTLPFEVWNSEIRGKRGLRKRPHP